MSQVLHHESTSLRTHFESTLHAYEDAADSLQHSGMNIHILRRAVSWLEHVITSLGSWSIDIRIESDSLSAIEGSEIEEKLQDTFHNLENDLQVYQQVLRANV